MARQSITFKQATHLSLAKPDCQYTNPFHIAASGAAAYRFENRGKGYRLRQVCVTSYRVALTWHPTLSQLHSENKMAKGKAAQIAKAGGDFEIVEGDLRSPGLGEVRIKVQACGICMGDELAKQGH